MMQTNDNDTATQPPAEVPTAPLTQSEIDWAKRLELAARMDSLKESNKESLAVLRTEYVSLLPIATPEQLRVVLDCARNETEIPVGFTPGEFFKLDPSHVALVAAARAERVVALSGDKAGHMKSVLADDAMKLVSYKVRVQSAKTIVTARFEKGGKAAAKAGLKARLEAYKAARQA